MVCALALWVAFEFAPAQVWLAELARYVPYPAYLLPAGGALALSLCLTWRWRIAALAVLGLVLVPIMGLQLGGGEAGTGRVRLLTYNIKAYRAAERKGGVAAIAWEVALHDADIIVMQDAGYLARLLEARSKEALAMFGERQIETSGQYIIASRFPMRNCTDGNISFPGERHHYFRCVVNAKGVEFDLSTAHLHSPREGLNATRHERLGGVDDWQENVAARMMQSRSLAADVAASVRPVILAGDLNAPEHSPVVRQLLATGLRDAFSVAGTGYGHTHGHSLRPHISFNRIDHILVSAKIGVADCFVGGKDASEHRPVIADLWLKRE
jgi:endonuclease/exonuclease/phosphatase (EEP) superfamily protein YafD